MKNNTDIDIDFASRDNALVGLHYIPAMVGKNGQRHPSGVYFQDVPINPLTLLSAFDYERAEEKGYFKIDFLNQSVYTGVRNEAHLDALMAADPPWELLDEPAFVERLPHIHKHFDILQIIKPMSIDDLAIVLALIRPGKRHLVNEPREIIDTQVWNLRESDGYVFKRSHAVSYAALVVVQMNLIVESLNGDELISF